MPFYVRLRGGEKIQATMQISKSSDPKTVGGVKLTLEELTAGIPDIGQLEEVGGRKQRLDVVLRDIDLAGVDVVHEDVEGLRVYPLQHDPGAVSLGEPREHCVEIRGTGSKNHLLKKILYRYIQLLKTFCYLVSWNLCAVCYQSDITQQS